MSLFPKPSNRIPREPKSPRTELTANRIHREPKITAALSVLASSDKKRLLRQRQSRGGLSSRKSAFYGSANRAGVCFVFLCEQLTTEFKLHTSGTPWYLSISITLWFWYLIAATTKLVSTLLCRKTKRRLNLSTTGWCSSARSNLNC